SATSALRKAGGVSTSAVQPPASPVAGRPRLASTKLNQPLYVQQQHQQQPDLVVSAPYSLLSSTSAAAAAAASAPVSSASSGALAALAAANSNKGRFDPFALQLDGGNALLTVPCKRFIVGKLQCKSPGFVHFRDERLCYMFIHPAAP